jgi:molecular chaperone DnaK
MKLGEAIYKAQQQDAEGRLDDDDAARPVDDDIVDADFEDLDDDASARNRP